MNLDIEILTKVLGEQAVRLIILESLIKEQDKQIKELNLRAETKPHEG